MVKTIEMLNWSKWKILFALLLFVGCNTDEYDMNKFAGVDEGWKPKFEVPIGSGSYELWDFIEAANEEDDTVFVRDPQDDLIHIIYTEDSIFTYDAAEMVEIPSEQGVDPFGVLVGETSIENSEFNAQVTLGEVKDAVNDPLLNSLSSGVPAPFPPVNSNDGGSYNTGANDTYQQVTFANGTMALTVTNNFPVDIKTFKIELRNNSNNPILDNANSPIAFTFTQLAASSSNTQTVNLTGVELPSTLQLAIVKFEVEGTGLTPVSINFSDDLDLKFKMTNLTVQSGVVKMIADEEFISEADTFSLDAGEVEGKKIKLFEAKFLNGKIKCDIQSDLQLNGKVVITLPAVKKNGSPLTIEKPLSKEDQSQVVTDPVDVVGFIFDLTAGLDTSNLIPYKYEVQLDGDVDGEYTEFKSTDEVTVSLSLTDLDLDYAKGHFGNQKVDLDNDEFEFDSDIFDMINGDFGLTDPRINLIIDNKQVGVNAKIDAQFTAYNDGETRDIFDLMNPNHGNLFLTSAEFDNPDWFTDTIKITNKNSSIVDFIALPPTDKITYGGEVVFNEGFEPTPENPNFITSESEMIIGMEVDLPLALQTNNLLIKDTITLDEPEVDGLDGAELVINYTNGLPLSVKMELQFVDTLSQKKIGRSIQVDPIQLPVVDADGKVTEVSTGEIAISLNDADIENLSQANGIAFEAKVSTPEGEVDGEIKPLPGKLFATDKLELRFGVKTQLDISEL